MDLPPTRRQQVLRALRHAEHPPTVSELARTLGVHGNTIRFHLDSLLADRLIEVDDEVDAAPTVGRPAIRYRAVRRLTPSTVRHFETLARLFLDDLTEDPEGGARAERIGESWGRRQAQSIPLGPVAGGKVPADVQGLGSLLETMGFEPDEPTPGAITMRACPFLESTGAVVGDEGADTTPESRADLPSVCAVHLGVVEGALDQWGGPTKVSRLVPFAGPDRCRIAFAHRTAK